MKSSDAIAKWVEENRVRLEQQNKEVRDCGNCKHTKLDVEEFPCWACRNDDGTVDFRNWEAGDSK